MNEINYTIIIPHKNIPQLLQRCLDSVPQRKDLEVIVVDDASNPDMVDFAHFPGSDRADVECIFTKEGQGAGYARNVGLKRAVGRWILFIDADDFFHADLLLKLDKFKNSDCNIIYFGTDSVDNETMVKMTPRIQYRVSEMPKSAFANIDWTWPCAKMIKADMIRKYDIVFEEVGFSNDEMFSLRCNYHAAGNVDKSDDLLLCITGRNGSLTRSVSAENVLCRLAVAIRCNKFIKKHLPGIQFRNTYAIMGRARILGKRVYRKALFYYLKHESFQILFSDFMKIVKFNIRHRIFKKV